jgi:hypothetical protein
VFVYGGYDDEDKNSLSSVEMLSVDGKTWATLPTAMFADGGFASVPLP